MPALLDGWAEQRVGRSNPPNFLGHLFMEVRKPARVDPDRAAPWRLDRGVEGVEGERERERENETAKRDRERAFSGYQVVSRWARW